MYYIARGSARVWREHLAHGAPKVWESVEARRRRTKLFEQLVTKILRSVTKLKPKFKSYDSATRTWIYISKFFPSNGMKWEERYGSKSTTESFRIEDLWTSFHCVTDLWTSWADWLWVLPPGLLLLIPVQCRPKQVGKIHSFSIK